MHPQTPFVNDRELRRYLNYAALVAGLLLIGLCLSSCRSIPVKQTAVITTSGIEQSLGIAQDFERAKCFNTPTTVDHPTIGESGRHCTNTVAATIGLTDDRHVALETAFKKGFDDIVIAAGQLKAWQSVTCTTCPAPNLATITDDVNQALALAQALIPGQQAQTLIADLQAVLKAAADVANAILAASKSSLVPTMRYQRAAYEAPPLEARPLLLHSIIASYMVLQFADLSTTEYGIGEGVFREGNPIIAPLVNKGPVWAAAIKGSVATGISWWLLHDHGRHPRLSLIGSIVATSIESAVVVHNARLLK